MKDLTFSNESGSIRVTYRVDAFTATGNLTVLEVYGLNDRRPSDIDTLEELALLAEFNKMPFTMQNFIDFAEANELELSIADTNGANGEVLVAIEEDGEPDPEPEITEIMFVSLTHEAFLGEDIDGDVEQTSFILTIEEGTDEDVVTIQLYADNNPVESAMFEPFSSTQYRVVSPQTEEVEYHVVATYSDDSTKSSLEDEVSYVGQEI